ncbi:hypothetical protein [Campylobacter concisus]|nr:hypothetical protein [Campylobacter concisus]
MAADYIAGQGNFACSDSLSAHKPRLPENEGSVGRRVSAKLKHWLQRN